MNLEIAKPGAVQCYKVVSVVYEPQGRIQDFGKGGGPHDC